MRTWMPTSMSFATAALVLTVHAAMADEAKPTDAVADEAQPTAAVASAAKATNGDPAHAATDSMSLAGGEEGTAFRSLTVEAENRVHITFERPDLHIELDPTQAPGLEWGSAEDVLNRTVPDLVTPMLASSAGQQTPYLAKPWLREFREGAVRSFRPEVDGVQSWNLTVADSRGEEVARFEGKGKPPKQLDWDGHTSSGDQAVVGLTYSFVLEAFDKAGNKRNFVGDGFTLPPYRRLDDDRLVLAFAGTDLGNWVVSQGAPQSTPALVLEAASWINQLDDEAQPVRVTVSARRFDQADRLANQIVTALQAHVCGDPARILALTDVRTDAPEAGSIRIEAQR